MTQDGAYVWGIVIAMALGSYLIRFSFLGIFGGWNLPSWLLRHLRYTPVAVLPGLVAPLVIGTGGGAGASETEPLRIAVCAVALGVGYATRNVIWGVLAAGVTFLVAGAVL